MECKGTVGGIILAKLTRNGTVKGTHGGIKTKVLTGLLKVHQEDP